MIQILHNPRCRKSREGLEILKESGQDFSIVPYLKEPPTPGRLREIIRYLGIEPAQLVRTSEPIWKERFEGKELTDEEIIQALAQYPKLIERPVVIRGQRAVIGRPPERISAFLNNGDR